MQIFYLKLSLASNQPLESLVIKKETVNTNVAFFQTLHFFANVYLRNIANVCYIITDLVISKHILKKMSWNPVQQKYLQRS